MPSSTTGRGGVVTIECEVTKEDKVIIHIIDTGMGISNNNLDSLFEPFNRLGAEHTGVEGTGIGLSITKRFVELMDGSIAVESIRGEGSRFSIELPLGENLEKPMERLETSRIS
jgi:signal transduction histidine kinase